MERRIEKLKKAMEDKKLDGFFVGKPANRYYLSGFTGSAGNILLTREKAYFITDFRYTEQATEQCPHMEIVEHRLNKMETVSDLVEKNGLSRIGFEAHFETYSTVEEQLKGKVSGVEWVPTEGLVEEIRLFKEEVEIEKIHNAVKLADDAFEHICSFIRPGMSEKEVSLELEFFYRKNGAKGSSFDIIVASGHRGALPHGVASDKIISRGDLIVIDMGADLDGYASDLTRTIAVGEAGNKEREVYDTVLKAQMAAIEGIKPGMTGIEADELARRVIRDAGYEERFGHGLGHGIGIEVHEQPRLSPKGEQTLKPGMVFTIEPGIYIPDWSGVRIEDIVILEENGVRPLTAASKEFRII